MLKFTLATSRSQNMERRLSSVEKDVERLEKSLGEFIDAAGGLPGTETKTNLRKLEEFIKKRNKEIKELKRRVKRLEEHA